MKHILRNMLNPYVKEIDFTYVPCSFTIFQLRKSTSGSNEIYVITVDCSTKLYNWTMVLVKTDRFDFPMMNVT